MFNFFKDSEIKMENKGEELIITVKGDKEKIASIEKKLKAMEELCGDDECCGGHGGKGCC